VISSEGAGFIWHPGSAKATNAANSQAQTRMVNSPPNDTLLTQKISMSVSRAEEKRG
jgi:hypothetical protein